ncbi:exodeoxyribonuclease VII large subunit [Legionella impletisoli]|uniref:Exodeoxyribonuclease 7 large subunit n=1 Tax=Legionella impletisoli TaxID=343510 RepID=A0A917JZR1_9GAMM|nr:exodeoxyribonuclease VII large subunit [Legionella impletisoli]GGI91661.1 exodeoxyribonuclease 7 large subunit [Legionella impletisoli]
MHDQSPVLTVTELNRHIRSLLEYEVGNVWVEGEVSNLSRPSSGHFYFTLKDATAQLRCVYFRSRHATGLKALENGMRLIAKGTLSIYEARGDFQLIVESLKEAGIGDLYRQFELLKAKLQTLGLFEPARKKSIPLFPDVIGIITSATGAALKDVLTTLSRRFPLASVKLYASEVQGKQAPSQLMKQLTQANVDKQCDVLLLVRGGGSIEDLWAFNDEQLAYAISKSTIPIVCGVGHETDFTIADFVADLRAATPTAAAESVTPNRDDLIALVHTLKMQLIRAISRDLNHKRFMLNHQIQTLVSPRQMILRHWQTLDYLYSHLLRIMKSILTQAKHQHHIINARLVAQNPARIVIDAKHRLHALKSTLEQQLNLSIADRRQTLAKLMATLQAVSPLATLERGYAIVTHQNRVLFDSSLVAIGESINIQLAKGKLIGEVLDKK